MSGIEFGQGDQKGDDGAGAELRFLEMLGMFVLEIPTITHNG